MQLSAKIALEMWCMDWSRRRRRHCYIRRGFRTLQNIINQLSKLLYYASYHIVLSMQLLNIFDDNKGIDF